MKFKLITAIDRINYFSNVFIKYYKQFFSTEEFYFMVHDVNSEKVKCYLREHGFTDEQMFDYKINRFGWGDNVINQNALKKKFLSEGYTVLYADMDELIFHPNLKEMIINHSDQIIMPKGVVIVQDVEDGPIDKTRGVLEQRNMCSINTYWFSKVCILKEKDFTWLPGRHTKPVEYKITPDLYLIDIGKSCMDIVIENNNVTKEIYKEVYWRYAEKSKEKMKNEYREFTNNKIEIPYIIKSSNLF